MMLGAMVSLEPDEWINTEFLYHKLEYYELEILR